MKIVDSTFLIALLRNDPDTIKKAKELDSEGGAATTVINIFEVAHGVYRSMSETERRMEDLQRLITNLEILDLDLDSAYKAAEISDTLKREGNEIDPFDCLIAGIALTQGADSVVTRNLNQFNRIQGLPVEEH